jgi:hypothetical protein
MRNFSKVKRRMLIKISWKRKQKGGLLLRFVHVLKNVLDGVTEHRNS